MIFAGLPTDSWEQRSTNLGAQHYNLDISPQTLKICGEKLYDSPGNMQLWRFGFRSAADWIGVAKLTYPILVKALRDLPDMQHPVKPYIFAVQCVVNSQDPSNRTVAPMKQSLQPSIHKIS
ncbi:hypothetical protein GQX74_014012 [Glossina fuscipes]|nr:hypothetical protein GQX74_014012 [Glossina fuscipes]